MRPTAEQEEIVNAAVRGENIALLARAGTAKSTTLQMVVDALPRKSFVFSSFNKHNCESFEQRQNKNVSVKTSHSIGYCLLTETNSVQVLRDKSAFLFKRLKIRGARVLAFQKAWDLFRLHGCSKPDDWYDIFDFVGKDLQKAAQLLIEHTEALIDLNTALYKVSGTIDFVDMLWLPVQLGLDSESLNCDSLLLDESQDFSTAALNLFQHVCRNSKVQVLAALDPMQNIYHSLGAGENNLETLTSMFALKPYKLTTCFRCDSKIINLAQKFVPDIVSSSKDPNSGLVVSLDTLPDKLDKHALVLAPTNASLMFEYIPRRLKGDNIAFKGHSFVDTVARAINKDTEKGTLYEILSRASSKWILELDNLPHTIGNEDRRTYLQACLGTAEAMHANFDSVEALRIFLENENLNVGTPDNVFSTIHKAKGTESTAVYLMDYDTLSDRQRFNCDSRVREAVAMLLYVGITRAKHTLYLVAAAEVGTLGESGLLIGC